MQDARLPKDERCLEDGRKGVCSFYTCFNERHQCPDSTNYAIKYGWRFCSRFELYRDQLTLEGKRWLNGTRLCAMEKLLEFYRADSISCSDVETEMKASEAVCEAENGLCHGRLLIDNKEIFSDVYALNHQSVARFLHSIKQCTIVKFREAAAWFSDQLHNVRGVGDSVLPFFQELDQHVEQLKGNFQSRFSPLSDTFSEIRRGFESSNSGQQDDEEID